MAVRIRCVLCGNLAWEYPKGAHNRYELKCDTCSVYQLASGLERGLRCLPDDDRLALSVYVREQYGKTGKPVLLDTLMNFRTIIEHYRNRRK